MGGERQKDATAGAVSCCISTAADAQDALVFLHDALAHPQAQSGAFGVLGSKEGLKDLRHVFRRNAATIIRHGHSYALALLPVMPMPHTDMDIARPGNSFNGIQNEVANYLPQFAGERRQRKDLTDIPMHS